MVAEREPGPVLASPPRRFIDRLDDFPALPVAIPPTATGSDPETVVLSTSVRSTGLLDDEESWLCENGDVIDYSQSLFGDNELFSLASVREHVPEIDPPSQAPLPQAPTFKILKRVEDRPLVPDAPATETIAHPGHRFASKSGPKKAMTAGLSTGLSKVSSTALSTPSSTLSPKSTSKPTSTAKPKPTSKPMSTSTSTSTSTPKSTSKSMSTPKPKPTPTPTSKSTHTSAPQHMSTKKTATPNTKHTPEQREECTPTAPKAALKFYSKKAQDKSKPHAQ